MATVAFLGTGLLGQGMVEGMLRRGDAVTVWNRTEAKARALEGRREGRGDAGRRGGRRRARAHDAADDAVVERCSRGCRRGCAGASSSITSTTSPGGAKARHAERSRRAA